MSKARQKYTFEIKLLTETPMAFIGVPLTRRLV
jgi:hypothetical protein